MPDYQCLSVCKYRHFSQMNQGKGLFSTLAKFSPLKQLLKKYQFVDFHQFMIFHFFANQICSSCGLIHVNANSLFKAKILRMI